MISRYSLLKASGMATMRDCEIIEGDCIGVMGGMEAGRARLVFADPPYNIGVDYGDHYDDRRTAGDYVAWCRRWMEASARLLTPDGSIWVMCDPRWGGRLQCLLEDLGLHYRETIIWHETFGVHCEGKFGRDHRPIYRFTKHPKRQVFHPARVPSARQLVYHDKRANPEGRVPSNVWTIPRVCGTFKERLADFPTQLPLELVRRVVRTASDPGDLVVDPFSGSATTGVACVEEGRRYVGAELSEDFAAKSRERLRVCDSATPAATTALTEAPGCPQGLLF
jgi:DNA modification methylase